jgi:hypothetical protein
MPYVVRGQLRSHDQLSDPQIPIDPIETDSFAIPTAKKSRAGGRTAKRGGLPSAKERDRCAVQAFLDFEQRTNDERHKYRVANTPELEGWIGPAEAKAFKEHIADLEQNLSVEKQLSEADNKGHPLSQQQSRSRRVIPCKYGPKKDAVFFGQFITVWSYLSGRRGCWRWPSAILIC